MSVLLSRVRRSDGPFLRAALAASQLAALFAFAGPLAAIHGFPLDDAWIHQVVARTFAESGTLGYAAGHHGGGATSFLWPLLLATNFRFVHADPVAFTFALNLALMLGAGQCLLAMMLAARPDDEPPRVWSVKSLVVVVLASFGGNYLWFAFSGMEAVLFTFLSLLAILVYASPGRSPRVTAALAGACAAALALTRPEGALLGPLLFVASFKMRRSWREGAILIAPWTLALAVYAATNYFATGTVLPATLSGRQWLWANGNAGLSHGALLVDFIEVWSLRLRDYTLGTSSMVAFWISAGLFAFGVARLVSAARSSEARARVEGSTGAGGAALVLTLVWAAVHLSTYALLMPSPGQGGRYQPLVPLLYLAGVAFGSITLADDAARVALRTRSARTDAQPAARVALALAAVAPWAALVAVGVRDWRLDHMRAVTHIEETEVALGALVDRLPANAVVASFDIGGVGFASKRPIVDAGGLSDKRSATLLAAGRIWEYLKEREVDYLVLPLPHREVLPDPMNFGFRLALFDNPAIELEPIAQLESPPELWWPAFRSTWNSAPRQVLYRVRFTGAPAADASDRLGEAPELRDPEGLLRARERATVRRELSLLAGVNVMVALSVGAQPAPGAVSPPDAWRVSLGAWGVDVAAPDGEGTAIASAARAELAEWAAPYIDVRDFGGAAALAPHAIARAMRRLTNPQFYPMLPPVPLPARGGGASDFDTTAPWGAPLAALVIAVAFARGLCTSVRKLVTTRRAGP